MRRAAEYGADLTGRLLAFGRRQTLLPRPTDINELLGESYAAGNPDVHPGSYVMIAIADSGCGMAPAVLGGPRPHLFRGRRGTVVRLYLPRSREVAIPAVAAPVELPTRSETILLVEDDPLVRAFAATQLAALGYRVVTAEHARRAIEMVEGGCAPDLLFTDMIMPGGMNGGELAEQLRRRNPGLKVLYTSGYAHNAMTGEAAASAQVMHLLGKPYRRRDLAIKVREALDEPAAA
jgi:CheY-like chemotaxis protein